MLPPLFLDVQPHHKFCRLLICVRPLVQSATLGSSACAAWQDTATETSIPSGLLIANDSDSKRAHLLIHQSARLPSPAFMVTNLDASIFPILRLPITTADPHRGIKKSLNQLLFDRILCDVPCSGNGTLRKNIGIWKWCLHSLQTRILQRAMRMLEHDGRIVYSTCSLNPVENEAVVAAALNSNPDFQLIDVSAQELVRRPGISSWAPTVNRTINTTIKTWDAYNETLMEEQRADSKIADTRMFSGRDPAACPSTDKLLSVDERDRLHIWDLKDLAEPPKSTRFDHAINAVMSSPSHTHVFLALQLGEIRTYDLLCLTKLTYVIPNLWNMFQTKIASSVADPLHALPGCNILVDLVAHPRDLNLIFVAFGGVVVLYDLSSHNILRAYELVIPAGAPGGGGYHQAEVLAHRWPSVTSVSIHPAGHFFGGRQRSASDGAN
ncbi:S-adenosyl-L-methionine-dependent methyltransferase [Suillus placidus]|uniref:S-adenosyl-L-methionine-dependent methyltransferase n=1 Tax=Suillus placidus TaxID=48579 RepID=A0A9P7D3U9_9AGAM|nr:S-adenosyl-L-methionine-dependent methyltransferase [Suillus placidus]